MRFGLANVCNLSTVTIRKLVYGNLPVRIGCYGPFNLSEKYTRGALAANYQAQLNQADSTERITLSASVKTHLTRRIKLHEHIGK